MALPIKRSLPSLSEITSPSVGLPKTLRTSLENTQSCPCKIRARGLTTIPAMVKQTSNAQRPTSNVQLAIATIRVAQLPNIERPSVIPSPSTSLRTGSVEESLEIKSRDVSSLRIKLRLGRRLHST